MRGMWWREGREAYRIDRRLEGFEFDDSGGDLFLSVGGEFLELVVLEYTAVPGTELEVCFLVASVC